MLFFFSSKRRHTRYWRDWSSDVCSSDLDARPKISNPRPDSAVYFRPNHGIPFPDFMSQSPATLTLLINVSAPSTSTSPSSSESGSLCAEPPFEAKSAKRLFCAEISVAQKSKHTIEVYVCW